MKEKNRKLVLCLALFILIATAAYPFVEVYISWQEADITSRAQYGMGIMEWEVLPAGDEYEIDITEFITSMLALTSMPVLYMAMKARPPQATEIETEEE